MKTMNARMLIVAALFAGATACCSRTPTAGLVRPKVEQIQFMKYRMEVTRDDASLPIDLKVYDEKKNLVPSIVVKYGEVQICVPKRPEGADPKRAEGGESKPLAIGTEYCEHVSFVSPGMLLKSGAHSTCFGDLGGGYFGYYYCRP